MRRGLSWRLLVHERHLDREAILGRAEWRGRVQLLPGRSLGNLIVLGRSLRSCASRCGLLLTPTRADTLMLVLLSLWHRNPTIVLHRLLEFPAPGATWVRPLGALFLRCYWSLMSAKVRALVFSPRLGRRLETTWKGRVDSLSLGSSESIAWSALSDRRLRLFLPGPLVSRIKKIEPLLTALPRLRELPVTFVVVGGSLPHGSTSQSLPELRDDPQFEWHVASWIDHARYLEIASGCHAVLQLPGFLPEDAAVSAALHLAEGLPRPLLHPAEEPGTLKGLHYTGGDGLADRIIGLWRLLEAGQWPEQMARLTCQALGLRQYTEHVLRRLAGQEKAEPLPDPRGL